MTYTHAYSTLPALMHHMNEMYIISLEHALPFVLPNSGGSAVPTSVCVCVCVCVCVRACVN